jgi:hypothetical protein
MEVTSRALVSLSLHLSNSVVEYQEIAKIDFFWDSVGEFYSILTGSFRTRCKALKCLRRVTRIPQIAPVLVRNRTDVLARLMGLLDDHKRVIRQHGALTVNIWSMVGQES